MNSYDIIGGVCAIGGFLLSVCLYCYYLARIIIIEDDKEDKDNE